MCAPKDIRLNDNVILNKLGHTLCISWNSYFSHSFIGEIHYVYGMHDTVFCNKSIYVFGLGPISGKEL